MGISMELIGVRVIWVGICLVGGRTIKGLSGWWAE